MAKNWQPHLDVLNERVDSDLGKNRNDSAFQFLTLKALVLIGRILSEILIVLSRRI